MKNTIFYVLTAVLFCSSCSDKQENGHWVQHYIATYATGEYKLMALRENKGIALSLDNIKFISSPDKYPGIRADRYLEIAERNGDMSYNRFADYAWEFRIAYADNFASMHLTSDKDWDRTHPAGSSLDDLIWVNAACYDQYIRNGYTGDEIHYIDKPLDNLGSNELSVVCDRGTYRNPDFYFLSVPLTDEEHTLTLTITTTEGAVHRPTITLRPKLYIPSENSAATP